ncbi:HPr kinase/phosphorylase [Thalassospira mesophila]|uniref:HPr kinase/phosphorylase C-terminal domain-containing protein n=1 Tax=Thalassospira mesophila TaxID=1293891 RepID=A0A1Y2KY77_9PROT|nr:HPr kinase/phosphatase C-terminal domain-containing protein [Thalassospira mesophila]OSQ37063.1 hypothetical protein TMES_16215 [Thalassospira mesophila]
MTQLHANCVAFDGQGILVRGLSGSGKSDLSLRLILRGAQLVSDDRTDLVARDGALVASAPEQIAGLIEIRGLGVITGISHCRHAEICMIADLVEPGSDDIIDRMPELASEMLCGVSIPVWKINAFEASAPDKIEIALAVATGKMRIIS